MDKTLTWWCIPVFLGFHAVLVRNECILSITHSAGFLGSTPRNGSGDSNLNGVGQVKSGVNMICGSEHEAETNHPSPFCPWNPK